MAEHRTVDNENTEHSAQGKLKLKQLVVVEGKYDKLKLENIIDAPIIAIQGFGIYKNKDKKRFIRDYGNKNGVVILTDGDSAGMQLRNYIKKLVDDKKIAHIFIPDVYGKEKRKTKPSKEGKVGVEGISDETLRDSFKKLTSKENEPSEPKFEQSFLYECGLVGKVESALLRKELFKTVGLPEKTNNTFLYKILSQEYEKDDLKNLVESIKNNDLL